MPPRPTAYITGQADLFATNSLIVPDLMKRAPNKEFDLKFVIRRSPAHMGVRMGSNWCFAVAQQLHLLQHHERRARQAAPEMACRAYGAAADALASPVSSRGPRARTSYGTLADCLDV